MAKILPFKGVLYNKKKINRLEKVMAPPYDVISPDMREELYKAHSNNIVRIILGREARGDNSKKNKYTRAANFLSQWLSEGILQKDGKPAVYIYEEDYLHRGQLKKRLGFISLMKIEDPSSGLVLPHEYTFSKPKEDRLNLIRATRANTSPIFCIYQDDGAKVTKMLKDCIAGAPAVIDIHLEGVAHKVWRLTDARTISAIKKEFENKQVFIADGHHRYEVALAFRDEMRKRLGKAKAKKYDNVMVYFSDLADEGLVIFSTYRVIRKLGTSSWEDVRDKLSACFDIEEVKDKDRMFDELEKAGQGYAFGAYFRDRRFYVLRLKDEKALDEVIKVDKSREWKRLNVTVLHFLVFDHILEIEKFLDNDKNIIYTRDEGYAVDLVKKGECDIAFFQLPTKVSEVRTIARNGDRMPHKSTYFYPKLLTGLVINKF